MSRRGELTTQITMDRNRSIGTYFGAEADPHGSADRDAKLWTCLRRSDGQTADRCDATRSDYDELYNTGEPLITCRICGASHVGRPGTVLTTYTLSSIETACTAET